LLYGRYAQVNPAAPVATNTKAGTKAGEMQIASATGFGADLSYYLNNTFAITASLIKSNHEISEGGQKVGTLDMYIPSFMLNYHMNFGGIKPYLGAGGIYPIYTSDIKSGTFKGLEFDKTFGYVAEGGLEIEPFSGFIITASARRYFMKAGGSIAGNQLYQDIGIDPWVYSAGIAFKF
jgi:outer membrane protein